MRYMRLIKFNFPLLTLIAQLNIEYVTLTSNLINFIEMKLKKEVFLSYVL